MPGHRRGARTSQGGQIKSERKARDPVRTKSALLEAAVLEFAEKGFDGGRIDRIIAQAKCNQQMIYYYFGDKAGLYAAVLERVHTAIDENVSKMENWDDDPLRGIRSLIQHVWSFYAEHPEYGSIVNADTDASRSSFDTEIVTPFAASKTIEKITGMLQVGFDRRVFRTDVDPFFVYVSMTALCVFYLVHNRSLSAMSGRDLGCSAVTELWREHVEDTILAALGATPPGLAGGCRG